MKGCVLFLVLGAFAKTAFSQQCSELTQRECSQDGLDAIEAGDCKSLRRGFDCLVFQSSMCMSDNVHAVLRPKLQQMYNFLKSNEECISDYEEGKWCYEESELRYCDFYHPARGSTCSTFDKFRNCVIRAVQVDCRSSYMDMLYTYLTKKGEDNAWKCPKFHYGPVGPSVEQSTSALPYGCRDEKLQTCVDESSPAMESNNCGEVRKNYNCIMWQSTRCLNNDAKMAMRPKLVELWNYLENSCEGEAAWNDSFCYKKPEIKECERSRHFEECSSFISFKSCVQTVVDMECFRSDRLLLPTYFTHKAGESAWNCPKYGDIAYSASRMYPQRSYIAMF